MTQREQMARDAFWGSNDALSDAILEQLGYQMDDISYSSNGASLADYITVVAAMTDDEIAEIMALA